MVLATVHFPCCVTENQYMDWNKSMEVTAIDTSSTVAPCVNAQCWGIVQTHIFHSSSWKASAHGTARCNVQEKEIVGCVQSPVLSFQHGLLKSRQRKVHEKHRQGARVQRCCPRPGARPVPSRSLTHPSPPACPAHGARTGPASILPVLCGCIPACDGARLGVEILLFIRRCPRDVCKLNIDKLLHIKCIGNRCTR